MIGGPYGAAASAICGILGAILSYSSPSQPDMATMLIQEVKKEIKREFSKFNRALQDQEFSGLDTRMRSMVKLMKSIAMNEISNNEPIPDRILFDTHLPHFTGKVAVNFTNCGKLTDEEACKNCVNSVVLYCKAQTAHIMLLSVIIAAFKSSGRETKLIERQLESAKAESIEKLAFLSDEMQMRKKSRQSRIQTLLAIYVLRSNQAYRVVEGFRESLGMEKLPPLNEIGLIALEARHCYPEDMTHRYARPHAWGADCHYFQLINHTEFPILVKCGNGAGKKVNLLQFTGKLNPYSFYEHVGTTKFNRTFSTGGVFVVYFENQARSEENMLENDGSRMKVFEFALSKTRLFGKDKSAILDMSDDFSPATKGQECRDAMRKGTVSNTPIYFEVDGLSYIAFTSYSTRGSNRCQTCRFVVQNYNPREMHLTFDQRKSFYEKPADVGYEQLDTSEFVPRQRSRPRRSIYERTQRVQFISDATQEFPSSGASEDAIDSKATVSFGHDKDDNDVPSSTPCENIERFPFLHTKHLVWFCFFAFFNVLLFVITKNMFDFYKISSNF